MRVFFALWPEQPVRQALLAAQRDFHAQVGGRCMRADTLHLTLLFIGEIKATQLPALIEAAGRVKTPPFQIEFDRLACWRHNHIAHLTCSQAPPALLALVGQIENEVVAMEVAFDRRNYHPHVTLIRQADCQKGNPASPVVNWQARDFVLLRSALGPEGAHYEQLGRWPLSM
jgi:2'-5' RNA ligase